MIHWPWASISPFVKVLDWKILVLVKHQYSMSLSIDDLKMIQENTNALPFAQLSLTVIIVDVCRVLREVSVSVLKNIVRFKLF